MPDELCVAGCWAHSKRKFAEIAKAVDKKSSNGSIAVEANRRCIFCVVKKSRHYLNG